MGEKGSSGLLRTLPPLLNTMFKRGLPGATEPVSRGRQAHGAHGLEHRRRAVSLAAERLPSPRRAGGCSCAPRGGCRTNLQYRGRRQRADPLPGSARSPSILQAAAVPGPRAVRRAAGSGFRNCSVVPHHSRCPASLEKGWKGSGHGTVVRTQSPTL